MFYNQLKKLAIAGAMGLIPAMSVSAQALKLSHSYQPTSIFNQNALWIADEIKAKTDGKYIIEVFPSGQMGNEREVEELISFSAVDIGFIGPGHMAQRYEPISIHLSPFLWRDYEHFMKYPMSQTYKEVTKGYEDISNNKIIALTYFGQRHVTANKPLKTPQSFKNVKMRVPPVPIYMAFPDAVKANSTPINFSELYLALQQGVVDAQENPLPTIYEQKIYEVQSDVMLTGHMFDGFFTVFSDSLWSQLNDKEKKIFTDVFQQGAKKTSDQIYQSEIDLIEKLKSEGVQVHAINKKAFADIVSESVKSKKWAWTNDQLNNIAEIK